MYSKKEVLVITTDIPSEGKIKKHLQPVTAHVVAGTNLFSDFFAGMSDIFGGRSGSYKKQLSSIYSEAIERIRQEAKRIGANGVVGLRIDIDEVSGGGKSMFMITAIGTAVVIEGDQLNRTNQKEFSTRSGVVLNEDVQRLKKRKILLRDVKNNDNFEFSTEVWEFIISNRIKEFFPFVISTLAKVLINPGHYTPETADNFSNNTKLFIQSLDHEDKIELLYKELKKPELSLKIRNFLHALIREEYLVNYSKVKELLNHNSIAVQKSGLIISTFDLEYYSVEDENTQKELIKEIEQTFVKRGEITTKKGMLSSKEKPVWKCECGKVNDEDITYCTKCGDDIYGFHDGELKPEKAISKINEKLMLLGEFQPS